MEKIRIAIIGYGNLGKGVEIAIKNCNDMELVGIFSRRLIKNLDYNPKVYHIDELLNFKDKIDVCILCGGSANDLKIQGPHIAQYFNTVDSFDNHKEIPAYYKMIDKSAKLGDNLSIISTGWDPGLFSINRLISESILPIGHSYTFWGKGVSQGHSDAIRRINGVKKAIQYTIPIEDTIKEIESGNCRNFSIRQMHIRECFVVSNEGADLNYIREQIENMPNYFSDYDTYVNFISEDEFERDHKTMPHGGIVFRNGQNSNGENQLYKFSLELSSNPEFTASVNVAFARAIYKLSKEGKKGCLTVFDIPLSYLSPLSKEEQIEKFL